MPCPPMDATTSSVAVTTKKMSRGATKKPSQSSSSSSSSSSWIARSMGFYHHHSSSSSKSRAQQPSPEAATDGKSSNSDSDKQSNAIDVNSSKKKKRSISIGRSMTCSSICSTKQSSVTNRDVGRSASSRSLRAAAADLDVVVDAVYASTAAAISATSSFSSDTTTAASTVVTTTTTTSSSSPLSSALSSPLSSSVGMSSFRGVHQFRKLSGCYQCHSAVFDPRSFAAAVFPCADCDEVFLKAESLEFHRATRHAVLELEPEDTSRNIVEIIFQSSWLKKQAPVCKIERILKVQSSDRTVKRFEEYRESIRVRAASSDDQGQGKKNPRCVADGNELLRFHCTSFTCSLGVAGGTALCRSPPSSAQPECKLCSIIRDGFRVDGEGKIATMATSGRAHDMAQVLSESDKRAMLVCRVVAGRVKKAADEKFSEDEDCDFDSVSPSTEGVYSDLDELFVFNPRAILPCFVVIYSGY